MSGPMPPFGQYPEQYRDPDQHYPTPPPGWYPDPSGVQGQRFFDGHTWTEQRTPAFPVRRKSPLVGALLQFFLGGLGIGRFYIGSYGIGVAQLCLGMLTLMTTGAQHSMLYLSYLLHLSLIGWPIFDVFYIGRGHAKDSQKRPVK